MNNQLKKYYRSIRRCLPCPGKLKNQIMDSIQVQVSTYLEETPAADFAAVEQRFGTPQQIAAAYIEEMTTPEILKKFKFKKTVITIVTAAAAIIVSIWLITVGIALHNEIKSADGYYDVSSVISE